MNQPARDQATTATHRLDTTSIGELLVTVEQIGANKGDPIVIDLYRTSIVQRGGTERQSRAAWFNLSTEWNLAGERDRAILAYRATLALRPDRSWFTEANRAATIGDIAEFTSHYEQSLILINRGLREVAPDAAGPVTASVPEEVLSGSVAA